MKIEKKIKEMFNAVFEPREDFMKLSKARQDVLLNVLRDDIIEGFEALERDYLKLKKLTNVTRKTKESN